MAGDPHQLGPVVRSSLAERHGLSVSLLERLMADPLYRPSQLGYNTRCITKLVRNFRSHSALLSLPARLYYQGDLKPCANQELVNSCLGWDGLTPAAREREIPLLVHGVVGQDRRDAASPSFYNLEEIMLVEKYVTDLLQNSGLGLEEEMIGVIAPYRKQCMRLRERLQDQGFSSITVGTTEEFQGQERRCIILSTVRSSSEYVTLDLKCKLGFLKDSKRFNVAITRAQALLIVVGNPNILYQDHDWRELLDYAHSNGCYRGCDFPGEEGAEGLGSEEEKFARQLTECWLKEES